MEQGYCKRRVIYQIGYIKAQTLTFVTATLELMKKMTVRSPTISIFIVRAGYTTEIFLVWQHILLCGRLHTNGYIQADMFFDSKEIKLMPSFLMLVFKNLIYTQC